MDNRQFQYSLDFLQMLVEYVGQDALDLEAYQRVEWAEGFFGAIRPYLDLPGKRMLDAGCGHGVLALGGNLQGMSVDAFDIVPKVVAITNQRLAETGYPEGAFEHDIRLSVPEGFTEAFDLITNFQVIEHIPRRDQFAVIRNLCRMMKPGGFLFIDTENSSIHMIVTTQGCR